MEGLNRLYRRVFGTDGLKLLGFLAIAAAVLGLLALLRELFGPEPIRLLVGGLVVFTAGAYFGMWLERRRISDMIGLEIKSDL